MRRQVVVNERVIRLLVTSCCISTYIAGDSMDNQQQRIRQRAYEEAARLRNQAASDAVNRTRELMLKVHTQQHPRMMAAGKGTGENVHDYRKDMGKFILVFIIMAVIGILLFALFVLIVSSMG